MNRTIMHNLERELKSAIKARDPLAENAVLLKINEERSRHAYYNYRFAKAAKFINKTFVSNEVIVATTKLTTADTHQEIDGDIQNYKGFVENVMDVDLSEVEIIRVSGRFDLAEGKAIPCAEREHIVLLPPIGDDFVSPDLLIHELGHTAEFTLRRQIPDDDCITNFGILSETVAHFCQFRYLRESGSPVERLSAIASVLPGYVLLKAVQTTETNPNLRDVLIPEMIIGRPEVRDVQRAMGVNHFSSFLEAYRNKPIPLIYHKLVVERMGAIIALHFLDDATTVRKFCSVKPLDTLEETLKSIGVDTNVALDFTKADDLIKAFLK